jgi:hypothetical protein
MRQRKSGSAGAAGSPAAPLGEKPRSESDEEGVFMSAVNGQA